MSENVLDTYNIQFKYILPNLFKYLLFKVLSLQICFY